ncbi:hypothetical protein QAD02_017873 [Eretmocerus hayati]|uniref:Uncharacterized protein n=1 Tax=Eretmocerus hayati TaxID=131215 RepID=A0ACC2PGD6_9HYME|nr:hypothetical protein QAD02_017873 [Eretmocerus hayati]
MNNTAEFRLEIPSLLDLAKERVFDKHYFFALQILDALEADYCNYCRIRVYLHHDNIHTGKLQSFSSKLGVIQYLESSDGKISPPTFSNLSKVLTLDLLLALHQLKENIYLKHSIKSDHTGYFIDRFVWFELHCGFFNDLPFLVDTSELDKFHESVSEDSENDITIREQSPEPEPPIFFEQPIPNDFNMAIVTLKDALKVVPESNGKKPPLSVFFEGCDEAKEMLSMTPVNVLLRGKTFVFFVIDLVMSLQTVISNSTVNPVSFVIKLAIKQIIVSKSRVR